ncbi:MAG: AI-2E family transporter [Rubripirellula sp.]|nr:AI-2E family transporter [Rubripirellula sp.]
MAKRRRNSKSSPSDDNSEAQTPAPDQQDKADVAEPPTSSAAIEASSVATSNALASFPSMARILSVAVLILGIIAVGALFYKVMAGFFVPLFLAALLVVIFRPVHQWFGHRLNGRQRMAALATTGTVLLVVLLPIVFLISVATSQFTAMVSHVNFADLSSGLDRAREQLGVSLPYAEQFRRLDVLADTLDQPDEPDVELPHLEMQKRTEEALTLVQFLQSEVDGPAEADLAASDAETKLQAFAAAVIQRSERTNDEVIDQVTSEEQFHRLSLSAAASIRSWMRTLLGGPFYSQIRMIANPSAEDFKDLLVRGREILQPRFVSVTSATGSFLAQTLIGMIVLIISVYFFLIDGPAMIRTLMRLSPLDDAYEERLLLEFDRTSRAVVLASVLSALAQGILASIGFWITGFDSVILLFLLTSVMALVPFLGAASVWAPCALYLAAVEERIGAAVMLAIYGAGIVSSIDNVIKVFILHGQSALHPLLALLSVLGGVKVFGPIGILVGPMVVVFLQTLLEILNHELSEREITGQPQITSTIVSKTDGE